MRRFLLVLLVAAGCGVEPCPPHAAPTADPTVCMCECGWQPDVDGGACVPLAEDCTRGVIPP